MIRKKLMCGMLALTMFGCDAANEQPANTDTAVNEPNEGKAMKKMKDIPKATWIWNAYALDTSILSDLKKQHVKKVYIQIETELSIEDYAPFIRAANQKGIDIYALAGESTWATNRKQARATMAWIEQAQQQTQLFTGVHLDVEPYTLKSYSTKKQPILENYFEVLKEYRKMTNSYNMRLEADIPFWYDEELYENRYGQGKVSDFVIRVTDEVAIMAYRQKAQDIIDITAHERNYAKKKGKTLTIAVETHPSETEPQVSFANSTVANFEKQVETVHAKTNMPIGIHFLDSWRSLYDQ